MRFMVLVKANEISESGALPTEADIVTMGKFNEELVKGGVLLAADGQHASSRGVRMQPTPRGKRTITDGPFTETKELIAGFWMIQVKSKEEAIEWFSHCPAEAGEIELRQVFDEADFAPVIESDEGRAAMKAEGEFRRRATV